MSRELSMIINHWAPTFTRLYGHAWPQSYLTLDTEYAGLNDQKAIIVDIGHVLIRDQQVVDRGSFLLDWSDHPIVPESWARMEIAKTAKRMQTQGKSWHYSWERLCAEGVKADKVLNFYHRFFQTVEEQKLCFVAHNAFTADERMLRGNFEGFLGKTFRFPENQIIDTGAIEKASIGMTDPRFMGERHIWLPQPKDTLASYFRRVTSRPVKGLFWNLEGCIAKYELAEKHALDVTQSHSADFDAYAVFLLMETFRKMITVDHTGESPLQSPETFARFFDQEMAKSHARQERPEPVQEPSRVESPQRQVRRRGQRRL